MSELTFKCFGTQIDCSRNTVMNVDAISFGPNDTLTGPWWCTTRRASPP